MPDLLTTIFDAKAAIEREGDRYMQRDDSSHTSLVDVCVGLHMSNTGAGEPLPDADFARYVGWLIMRTETWCYISGCAFDAAVLNLVNVTIAESLSVARRAA